MIFPGGENPKDHPPGRFTPDETPGVPARHSVLPET